jgi:IclR family transcriptional regulator, acetate operon repressor
MQNRPPYAIKSVDHALHLVRILQYEGPLGVAEAAERLGVARSTAHRSLAMLVYRDFARKDADHQYWATELMRPTIPTVAPVSALRRIAPRRMQWVVTRTQETSNLFVLAGTEVRIIASVECSQEFRVSDRADRTRPAHLCSGGKVLLAALSAQEVRELYGSHPDVGLRELEHELDLVRRRGWAINNQLIEVGLTAICVPIRSPANEVVAALSIAMPSGRFLRDRLPGWISTLWSAAAEIKRDLCTANGNLLIPDVEAQAHLSGAARPRPPL